MIYIYYNIFLYEQNILKTNTKHFELNFEVIFEVKFNFFENSFILILKLNDFEITV